MNPPPDDLRGEVATFTRELRDRPDLEAEEGLLSVLNAIDGSLRAELDRNPPREGDDPEELAGACNAWASLISHALTEVYAPASPLPRKLAGWGSNAIVRVQRIINVLRAPVMKAQRSLGASSYSIGVGFPWGVSISFTWP